MKAAKSLRSGMRRFQNHVREELFWTLAREEMTGNDTARAAEVLGLTIPFTVAGGRVDRVSSRQCSTPENGRPATGKFGCWAGLQMVGRKGGFPETGT
jgi:hypothetical protein